MMNAFIGARRDDGGGRSAKITWFRARLGLLCRSLPLLLGLFGACAAQAGDPYPFDQSGYLGEAVLMPDWAATMARQQSQAAVLDSCLADEASCPRFYRGLRHLLLKAEVLPARKQLMLVHQYVNRKRYQQDKSDRLETPLTEGPVKYHSRWSTVEEFMRRGGDCEDYATTKYYLLRKLGFDADQLRIVVTWDRQARAYHAVLAVNQDSRVMLLESDNTIRYGRRHAYRFIYSVNEKSIWDHETQASVSRDSHPQEETPA
jgi:predicted transglutaminase-like cysteine proteinase